MAVMTYINLLGGNLESWLRVQLTHWKQ